jgi:hypothetical protein
MAKSQKKKVTPKVAVPEANLIVYLAAPHMVQMMFYDMDRAKKQLARIHAWLEKKDDKQLILTGDAATFILSSHYDISGVLLAALPQVNAMNVASQLSANRMMQEQQAAG